MRKFGVIASGRTRRVRGVQGSSLVGVMIAVVILTLTFSAAYLAIQGDGAAAALQSSRVQAATVANSILNLEEANSGCGDYTPLAASSVSSSLNLGAFSTWNTTLGSVTIGTADGDWSISGGDSWSYIGTGSPAGWEYPYSQPVTVYAGETLQLSANVDARNVTAGGPAMGIYSYVPGVGMDSGEFGLWQTAGVDSTLSGQWTVPQGINQVVVFPDTSDATVTAGQSVTWSQIQLQVVNSLSGTGAQSMPCQISAPSSAYHQEGSTQPSNLSSCGTAPGGGTLNLEQASPSPWFCVSYSNTVLWGYVTSSWVIPTTDSSVCPGDAGEASAVPVARLVKRTVVLKSQALNQPVETYTYSRTSAPSVGPLPATESSSSGLRSVLITGVPSGDYAELSVTVWTGGTGGASESQLFFTGSPDSEGRVFFPGIPAAATQVEYWITPTPSIANPPSMASGTSIPSLANVVTCEVG